MVQNDYEAAIGVFEHKIGNIEHRIIPKEGDNMRIARIMKMASKNGIDWLYQEFNNIYYDMVVRDDTTIPEDKLPRLKLWIEKNQVQIQKDLLITFGWQTKEQQDKLDEWKVIQDAKVISLEKGTGFEYSNQCSIL